MNDGITGPKIEDRAPEHPFADGGPAFPLSARNWPGMTLRDYAEIEFIKAAIGRGDMTVASAIDDAQYIAKVWLASRVTR